MMSQTDVVHVAFDKTLKAYTPFPSASDALLANFILQHDLGEALNIQTIFQTFDTIVNLITQPGFNADEVTIRSAADCYDHVGKQRSVILEERDAACRTQSLLKVGVADNVTTLPSVVLDCTFTLLKEIVDSLILETFYKDGAHLFNRADRYRDMYRKGHNSRELMSIFKILSDMCLVQKLWTTPAMRVLGRYIVVANGAYPNALNCSLVSLRSPIFGPWTRAANFQRWSDEYETLLLKRLCNTRIGNLRSLQFRLTLDYAPQVDVIKDIVLGLPLLSIIHMDTSLSITSIVIPDFFKSLSQSQAPITLVSLSCLQSELTEFALLESAHFIAELLPIRTLKLVHLRLFDRSGSGFYVLQNVVWRRTEVDGHVGFHLDSLRIGSLVEAVLRNPSGYYTRVVGPIENFLSRTPSLQIPFTPSADLAKALSRSTNLRELQVEATGEAASLSVIFSNLPSSLEHLGVHLDLDRLAKSPSVLTKTRFTKWVQSWGDALREFLGGPTTRRCPQLRRICVVFHWSNSPEQDGGSHSKLQGDKLAKWEKQITNITKKVETEVVRCKSKCRSLGDDVKFRWDVSFDDLEWC